MDWSLVSELVIPEGDVTTVTINGLPVWSRGGQEYDYGDGTYNTIENGYQNRIYLNGTLLTPYISITGNSYTWSPMPQRGANFDTAGLGFLLNEMGNYKALGSTNVLTTAIKQLASLSELHTTLEARQYQRINEGRNNYMFNEPIGARRTVFATIRGGGMTTSASISNFTLTCDGYDWTVSEAIDLGIIQPLVLTLGPTDGGIDLFLNDEATEITNYPQWSIVFITREPIEGIKFTSNKDFNSQYDGFLVNSYSETRLRLTLNEY